jgi:mannosylglycerate hydrolase MGH1-like protein
VNAERERLEKRRDKTEHWSWWGPYVSERQWGTVREDYSPYGTAWDYFPHDHARSRAYRWGEDGIAGISDLHQLLCFAPAFWNGNDPILKERLFGLTNSQGNHGEDVKEYYFYLDNVPSHAYMKMLYRYPHDAYPYQRLLDENARRTKSDPEFELIDTGIFNGNRFFDVQVEYAKAAPEDILVRITAINRGAASATIHLLPTLWYRNTWSWRQRSYKPSLRDVTPSGASNFRAIAAEHQTLGEFHLAIDGACDLLFTENETNYRRLFGAPNVNPYVKDGISDYVVHGSASAVNPARTGTKASAHFTRELSPGESFSIRLRLAKGALPGNPFAAFDEVVEKRRIEADEFYADVLDAPLDDDHRAIARQALAGMLWSKQFYYYNVQEWLDGDPAMPPPPPERKNGRNADWGFFHAADVLSMPDTWEYPWFAAWDAGFHCVTLALIDPDYAKKQLMLLTREWYMHPNGQIPAYEWAFADVNPPVMAWAAMRVYQIEARRTGREDRLFLERVFQKLLLSFTWWVNRKDAGGNNIFEGGFLGLDNIGVFDRNMTLPDGVTLEQSDGTAWMAIFSANMLQIALELATASPAYEDIASKFFAHFLYIAKAMNQSDGGLWDENDGFYYDALRGHGTTIPLRVRSLVGLLPLAACAVAYPKALEALPDFAKRVRWFVENRPDLVESIAYMEQAGIAERYLLALADVNKLTHLLRRMLDPAEFLSPYGIRSLSRVHLEHPYALDIGGNRYSIDYEPAESRTGTFGGNSNWRGPVWFPPNFLLIEALQKLHYYFGDDFKVEMPAGSGTYATLWEVATDLSERLIGIFTRDASGRRAVFGGNQTFQNDPLWRDFVPFYEYFHGDNGAGLGAAHQTGWTALVSKLILQCAEYRGKHPLDTRPQG